MNTLTITKKLVSIPSYVNEECNEKEIGKFIYKYLQKNTGLIVKKDIVEKNRFNIVAYSKNCLQNGRFEVDTLFINHIDTVEPKQGNRYGPFLGVVKNGRLYGLGACDTKANVAVLMKLAERVKNQKIMFLFYIDEEYDFKGIKAFTKKYKNRLKVSEIISADGEDLKIRNACRGLIEFDIQCIGKTGHSANSKNGASVISGFYKTIVEVEEYLKKNSDPLLGQTTMNISYLRAGLFLFKKNKEVLLGKNGNNIADYLNATIELRINRQFDLDEFLQNLKVWLKDEKLSTEALTLRFNFKPWLTEKDKLKRIFRKLKKNSIKPEFTNPAKTGYVDIALLNEVFNSECYCIGVSGKNRHGIDEWVDIKSVSKLEKVLIDLIT